MVDRFMGTLVVRVATESDLSLIVRFFAANPSENLPAPTFTALVQAFLDGAFYLALLEGEIVAVAGVFRIAQGADRHGAADDRDTIVLELAATRVLRAVGGLEPRRMQDILVSLRIIGSLVTKVGDGEGAVPASFLAAVMGPAETSRAALLRAGLRAVVDPPYWLQHEARTWIGGSNAEYLEVPRGAVGAHARALLELMEGDLHLRRTTEGIRQSFRIDLSVPWLHYARAAVELLAVMQTAKVVPPPRLLRITRDVLFDR